MRCDWFESWFWPTVSQNNVELVPSEGFFIGIA
jgi:hypothetical protein